MVNNRIYIRISINREEKTVKQKNLPRTQKQKNEEIKMISTYMKNNLTAIEVE